MTSTGLATKDGNLHEGDIILKVGIGQADSWLVHFHTQVSTQLNFVAVGVKSKTKAGKSSRVK